MVHKNIQIAGRVQGVGFRYSSRNAARIYKIKGYVRNMPDGSVYIEAEGSEPDVDKFTEWCKNGPSHAYVDDIAIEDGELQGYTVFDIKF